MPDAAPIEIELRHRHSGAKKTVRIVNVFGDTVVIEWPMSGHFGLRRQEQVWWKSNPKWLLQMWELTVGSIHKLNDLVEDKRAERRARQLKERYRTP